MADLVRVRHKSGPDKGKETVVGRAWLDRWPDDFEEASSTPVGEDKKPASAETKARTGKKRKG